MTCLLAFPSCATCLPSFASPVGVLHLLIVVPNWWAHCNIMTIHNDAVVRLAQPSDCATIADYNCRMAKVRTLTRRLASQNKLSPWACQARRKDSSKATPGPPWPAAWLLLGSTLA